MRRTRVKLSDLQPAFQKQAISQLGERNVETKKEPKTRQPNKTELRFYNDFLSDFEDVRYEALTFKLKNGHRYTPDWVVFREGLPRECIEVKGSYRFSSQNRSQMAWAQAKLDFPGLKWVWAVWDGKGKQWRVKEG